MGKATPNFNGARLTEAREARGWTQVQLAEALGVTGATISLYEKGERTPTWEMMEGIVKHLQFPNHRFASQLPPTSGDSIFFRSYAAATKAARTRAKRRLEWVIHDICAFLKTLVDFPRVNFPTLDLPADPIAFTRELIERAATETRRFWGLGDGPIPDMVMLLENNGAIVAHQEMAAVTLDAFSRWNSSDSRPYIILGIDKPSAVRARMNAAHELAHMVLHRHLRPAMVSNPKIHGILEGHAKYFASAFLLPASTFSGEVSSANLNAYAMIKTRWGVAIQAMIMRSKNLGLISDSERERLFVYLSQRGWRKHEPYDDQIPFERPKLVERSFDLILNSGMATRASIENAVGMFAIDIERATGLIAGFLGDDKPNFKFPGNKATA